MVLQGAVELLQEASFVQFEGSLVEYNQGGSCLHEIDDFLRRHGYFIYDFGDQMMNKARLFKTRGTGQFDALYIRPSSEHLPQHLLDVKPDFCGADRPPFVAHYPTTRIPSVVHRPLLRTTLLQMGVEQLTITFLGEARRMEQL